MTYMSQSPSIFEGNQGRNEMKSMEESSLQACRLWPEQPSAAQDHLFRDNTPYLGWTLLMNHNQEMPTDLPIDNPMR